MWFLYRTGLYNSHEVEKQQEFSVNAKQNGATTLKASVAVSYKLNTLFPHDLAVALLGIYPEELKTHVPHKNLQKDVYSSFI